jgi:hypothetical protein
VDTTEMVRGDAACVALDSMLAGTFPPRPWSLTGGVTFDVEDYRVRGRYRLSVNAAATAVFEFEGSMLFGGHREDVMLSLSGDTLRVLDRERTAYYQGEQVTDLIEKGTGVRGDWVPALRAALGFAPSCNDALEMHYDGEHISGVLDRGVFILTLDGDRLSRASWPDPTRSRTFSDRLEIRYSWKDDRVSEVRIAQPVRGWRIILTRDMAKD